MSTEKLISDLREALYADTSAVISYAKFDAAVHYMSYDITDTAVLAVVGRGYAAFTQHGPGGLVCEHDRLDTLIEGFWY